MIIVRRTPRMSCNGCRVLRKGCSDSCILRPCLQWVDTPEAQGHATVFVAKFFGRAGLMSFISAVAENQRPALFRSLLYEAAGRTVNPVNGAVGLLYSGNWIVCETAVETVLRGGTLKPLLETPASFPAKQKTSPDLSNNRSAVDDWSGDLGLCLNSYSPPIPSRPEKRRAVSPPSLISDSSVNSSHDSDESVYDRSKPKMLNLFV